MNKTFGLVSALLLAVVALCATSCGEDDFPDHPEIVGDWTLISANGVPKSMFDMIDFYKFHVGGRGEYKYEDENGNYQVAPFSWKVDANQDLVHITFDSPEMGNTALYFRYKDGTLFLSENPDFSPYNAYYMTFDKDVYLNPVIIGSWVLVRIENCPYIINEDYYTFDNDGTGVFKHYNQDTQQWQVDSFKWNLLVDHADLYITYDNPDLGGPHKYFCYYEGTELTLFNSGPYGGYTYVRMAASLN